MKTYLNTSWLVLLLLTATAYVIGIRHSAGDSSWFMLPLVLAVIKISIVAWYFMELRTVSRFWAVGFGFLTFVIFAMVAILHGNV